MELSLSSRTVADHVVLEVGGEVDVYTAPRLRERLVELVEAGSRSVVVDLGRVEFLDSTGLGVLIGALKRLRAAGGDLALVCNHERLLKTFRITALDRVFALHDSVAAATSATGATAATPETAATAANAATAPKTATTPNTATAANTAAEASAQGVPNAAERDAPDSVTDPTSA